MYIPIGSGDQEAAYYERERPSGSYSNSISHLILRAFSDRAHSIDLQRKGSQIVPLSKSRHFLRAARGSLLMERRKMEGINCGHPRVGVFFLPKKSRAKRARLCAKVEDSRPVCTEN
jgi:hypothetical protein